MWFSHDVDYFFFSFKYMKERNDGFHLSMKSFVVYESYTVWKIYVLFYSYDENKYIKF